MSKGLILLPPLLFLIACDRSGARQREPVKIETVDVDAGIDADLTTESDQVARPVEIDVSGMLPSDFPSGMPVPSPSSIVDFGPGFVEIDAPVPLAETRSSLGGRIERSGWTVEAIGEGGTTYSRAGRLVRVRLEAIGSVTRIRYEY